MVLFLSLIFISNIKSFLPVEAEISVTKNFITANMKNYKVGATYNAPEEQ
jgi:hypothetical protein